MNEALNDLEKFIANPGDLPLLILLALIHYQFEAIHPFMDGNGRVGRLLIPLLLCERGALPNPLLYLSAYLDRNREAYMNHLLHVSQTGAWSQWIEFFLDGVAEQSRDAVQRSQRLLDLWQSYRRRMQTARTPALLLQLVDKLFDSAAITVSRARRLLGVTARSAQLIIDKLQQAGILVEATGRQRYRVYIAREIMAMLEGPEDEVEETSSRAPAAATKRPATLGRRVSSPLK